MFFISDWIQGGTPVIEKFDHVAMVVPNTDETVELFSRLFGFETGDILTDDKAGFKSTIILKLLTSKRYLEPVTF